MVVVDLQQERQAALTDPAKRKRGEIENRCISSGGGFWLHRMLPWRSDSDIGIGLGVLHLTCSALLLQLSRSFLPPSFTVDMSL